MPGKRVTSNPENGQLSIDDTETTIEDTVSPQASATPTSTQPSSKNPEDELARFGLTGEAWHAKHGNGNCEPNNGKEPWLHWKVDKVHPYKGIPAREMQHVGWLIEQATGWQPTDGEWSGWVKAMGEMYQAANGDFEHIRGGIRSALDREEQYIPGHPMGFVKAIRKVKAKPKRRTSAQQVQDAEHRMHSDPQYQAAAQLQRMQS